MTLNKQRILSELGSVVNQLQSADCGCMGRLFGNTPQNMGCMNNSFPQHGSCGHGCYPTPCHGCHQRSPCCGDSHPINSVSQQRPFTCMGQCNAPKLYADTYNYLNENLMQPVVKEVYNDLSSLTPANTIMNNDMGSKMGMIQQGLGQNSVLNKSNANTMNSFNPQTAQMQSGVANTTMQNSPPVNVPNQQYFGGMGPQIVNMFKGEQNNKPIQPQEGLKGPMIIDAPQSPHGSVGVTPLTTPVNSNINKSYAQPNGNVMRPNFNQQQQYEANRPNTLSNPIQQPSLRQPSYGQHTQGMTKFNEMFPGVMQGLGGDLGFDPMAIAIQMNPANQQQVAMNTMQKIMNNNQNISKILEPSVKPEAQQEPLINTNQKLDQINHQNEMIPSANAIINKNIDDSPNVNQQQGGTQQYLSQTQVQRTVNLSPGSQNLSPIPEDPPNHLQNGQPIKEPIFPVDTTKQKIYYSLSAKKHVEPAQFNTLGQPVEKLPANMYRPVVPNLPQTLSPQPTNVQSKFTKVKPSASKTLLMGEKPTDKTPSRSQLQQIYKQYKGSQSYTKQNVTAQPVDGPTYSERHLNVKPDTRAQNIIPVEKLGGDSTISRRLNTIEPVKYDRIGDVPVQDKLGDLIKPEKDLPATNLKGRNGLQDMIYTSYPSSAAWSFHGDGKIGSTYPNHRGRRYHRY